VTATADDEAIALLKAQLVVQGAILQLVESATGLHGKPLEAPLAGFGLTQAEIGLILGKNQSTVSRALKPTGDLT
jgi:hypothetical protein